MTDDYPPGDTAFTGTIKLIDPAQSLLFVMAKQEPPQQEPGG